VAEPSAARFRGRASPARACALRVIRRVFEQGAYADRALASEAEGLAPRDRALATALAYGTVQRRATLDHVAAALVERPLERLEAPVLAVLRLGLFELMYLGGSAQHAAVNEAVELAKSETRGGVGLVNAVLRRGAREAPGMLEGLERAGDATPESAALLHSVPGWLASQWFSELGPETARELLRVVNLPAESALRVNTLVASVDGVAAALPVSSRTGAMGAGETIGGGLGAYEIPEALVLDGPFDVQGSELWRSGAVQPQSRGSMVVSRILDPQPGERVLDLCAAPGGKTTHVAALMGDRGEIVAVERHPGRAAALERTTARLRTASVRVEVGDAAAPRSDGQFDRVLVDPPCSGLGTLQSRPDLRWRVRPEAIGELAALQARILAAGARVLAPGGTLVYSVCTISRREGQEVIERFLEGHPEFSAEDMRQLLPHLDRTDGFSIARLRRG
jgi:16S rRNA (cytosine967-C5)-methyltransferase